MKQYVCVYLMDGIANPSIYFFKKDTKDIPVYLRDRIGQSIVTWDDFDIDDPRDTTGWKISKTAIKFLASIGIHTLEANESITIMEVPD
jgi:hypothetical protein